METAKVFYNGRSQAVRLPQKYRFKGKEVFIYREGAKVILSEKPSSWEEFFLSAQRPTSDFMQDRQQPEQQERDLFE